VTKRATSAGLHSFLGLLRISCAAIIWRASINWHQLKADCWKSMSFCVCPLFVVCFVRGSFISFGKCLRNKNKKEHGVGRGESPKVSIVSFMSCSLFRPHNELICGTPPHTKSLNGCPQLVRCAKTSREINDISDLTSI